MNWDHKGILFRKHSDPYSVTMNWDHKGMLFRNYSDPHSVTMHWDHKGMLFRNYSHPYGIHSFCRGGRIVSVLITAPSEASSLLFRGDESRSAGFGSFGLGVRVYGLGFRV